MRLWNKSHASRIIAIIVASCHLAACSFFGPTKEMVVVSSNPAGAQVIATGMLVGTTPMQFEAHRSDNLFLEISKTGYQTQYRTASRRLSTLGILDVFGGVILLLPLIGLLSSGAWEHEPAQFGVSLEPEKGSSKGQQQ
jgi:hypothetical protein